MEQASRCLLRRHPRRDTPGLRNGVDGRADPVMVGAQDIPNPGRHRIDRRGRNPCGVQHGKGGNTGVVHPSSGIVRQYPFRRERQDVLGQSQRGPSMGLADDHV